MPLPQGGIGGIGWQAVIVTDKAYVLSEEFEAIDVISTKDAHIPYEPDNLGIFGIFEFLA